MAEFLTAFKITAQNEGGYANVPGDNGGETYSGITRKNYPNWIGWKYVDAAKPLEQNEKIDSADLQSAVQNFYYLNYWQAIKGNAIEDQDLANQVYDMAVSSGVSEALKLLQNA